MLQEQIMCSCCEMSPATHATFYAVLIPLCWDCYYLLCYDRLKDYRKRYPKLKRKPGTQIILGVSCDKIFIDECAKIKELPFTQFHDPENFGGYLELEPIPKAEDQRGDEFKNPNRKKDYQTPKWQKIGKKRRVK